MGKAPLVQCLLEHLQPGLPGDEQHAACHVPSGTGRGDVGAKKELRRRRGEGSARMTKAEIEGDVGESTIVYNKRGLALSRFYKILAGPVHVYLCTSRKLRSRMSPIHFT